MSQTSLAKGSPSDEGGNGSVTLLKQPIGLRKLSTMLELMGRVVSTAPESSRQKSLCLRPADSAVGEGKRPHLQELRDLGDFSWPFKVGSLGQKGFLAKVESGHFGVEVLELRPNPHWGPLLLLECLALGDSTGVSEATAL